MNKKLLLLLSTLTIIACKQHTAQTPDTTLRMASKVYLGIPVINRISTEKTLTVTVGKNIALPLSIEIDDDEIIKASLDGELLTIISQKEGSTNITLVDRMGIESRPTNVVVTSKDIDLQVLGGYKTTLSLQSSIRLERNIQYGKDTALPLSVRFDDPSLATTNIIASNGRGYISFTPVKDGSTFYVLVDANGVESDEKLLQVGGPYDFEQPKELTIKVGETADFTATWPDINKLGLLQLKSNNYDVSNTNIVNNTSSTDTDHIYGTVQGSSIGETELYWTILNGANFDPLTGAPTVKVKVIE